MTYPGSARPEVRVISPTPGHLTYSRSPHPTRPTSPTSGHLTLPGPHHLPQPTLINFSLLAYQHSLFTGCYD